MAPAIPNAAGALLEASLSGRPGSGRGGGVQRVGTQSDESGFSGPSPRVELGHRWHPGVADIGGGVPGDDRPRKREVANILRLCSSLRLYDADDAPEVDHGTRRDGDGASRRNGRRCIPGGPGGPARGREVAQARDVRCLGMTDDFSLDRPVVVPAPACVVCEQPPADGKHDDVPLQRWVQDEPGKT